MPSKTPYTTNPFASPTKDSDSSTPFLTNADVTPQQPNILATANLFLHQLKELETLCSTVEARVQRKRQILKELEKLVAATTTEAPSLSPAFSGNTPFSRRLRPKSLRLRGLGLFDLRGPGKANRVALQSALDYSPEPQGATNLQDRVSVRQEAVQAVYEPSEEWEDNDDDDEAPSCPFDDKYALPGTLVHNPLNVEKSLPPIPMGQQDVQTTKIPKLYLNRRVSTSKYLTSRPGMAIRVPSSRRRSLSTRRGGAKALETFASPKKRGTMRRGSGRRGILENVNGQTKARVRVPHPNENENVKEGTRRKEKRKGLWSIYSIYSEFGLSGSHHNVRG